jgi:hydrogenase maturation protease
MSQAILVAGVGNIFLGDDGFGVEVARRLAAEALPAGVLVADFGIRGVHLAYQLLEGYDAVILVDALSRGAEPGTVFVLEPDWEEEEAGSSLDAHGLDPATVLRLVKTLGGTIGRLRVVGCEPAQLSAQIGLSAPVQHGVEKAIQMVKELVDEQLQQAAALQDI